MPKIDKDAFQQRLDRLNEIFTDMVNHAEEVSRYRCPYRNKSDQCTAAFRCRNQRIPDDEQAPVICGHDGTFDHRSAWESNPLSRRRAERKIEKIKRDAADKRNGKGAGEDPGKATP